MSRLMSIAVAAAGCLLVEGARTLWRRLSPAAAAPRPSRPGPAPRARRSDRPPGGPGAAPQLMCAAWVVWSAFVVAVLGGCGLPEGAPATAQRPTFCVSPATTAEGTWEVEAGVVVEPGDYAEVPTTWKYGLDGHTEVSIAASPVVHVDHSTGYGDLGLGWRHRVVDADGARPAFALLAFVKLPTADEDRGLGSGQTDGFGGATAGATIGRFTWNAFVQLGAVGVEHEGPDFERDATLMGTWAFDERNSSFAEIVDRDIQEQGFHSVQLRVGHYLAVRPDLVLDASVYLPANDDAPDTMFALGFTRNLGGRPATPRPTP